MSVTITEALRLAAATHLLLVAGLLLRHHRRSRVTFATTLLVGCVVCYLTHALLGRAGIVGPVRWAVDLGAVAVPFALWLAARLYFEDAFEPGPLHFAALAALIGVRSLVVPWRWASSAIAIVVVLDALRRIHAGVSTDLLVSRLRLRYVVVVASAAYALLILTGEAILRRGSPAEAVMGALNDLGLFALVATISMMVLRVDPDLVRVPKRSAPSADTPSVLERRLERLIDEERAYTEEGLTIGSLADRLGEQEYRVRQLINAHLGFRNFGAFLNHYRVRDARQLLADPAQKQLGIAEIAYRLGYASLGPFNRAFKELVGQTPTEYRKTAAEQPLRADSEIGETLSKRN